jgi:SAM-dependent methyltransferase
MSVIAETNQAWHPVWEQDVYSQGRQLNLYPYHAVVSFLFRRFGSAPDRADVRILELGCGAGNNLWCAAREGFQVAGIDGSSSAIVFARRRFEGDGLAGDLRVGSFTELPWEDASFDAVIDRAALACARRACIAQGLDESVRVLKPGGRLLSVIYSDEHPGRAFGRHLGDNTYDHFAGGYFQGLGMAHFCTRAEVEALYGTRFDITSLVHTLEENALSGCPEDAFWRIECEKPA